MKTLLTVWICSMALAVGALAQSPGAAGAAAASAASPASSASVSPAPGVSPAGSPESALEKSITKKHKGHFKFTIGDGDDKDKASEEGGSSDVPKELPEFVVAIIAIVFGTPVLIVAVIMYFGFSRGRMMHKTVRMMVEKGQPVPAALLNPPPHERKRSDLRRGVVLMMLGIGLVVLLGAVNDWENGAWSIGVIPLLIGVGYLIVWKLEGKGGSFEAGGDNPPPLP